MVHLSQLYVTTGKTIALTIWTFVGRVMSLLFNTLDLPQLSCQEAISSDFIAVIICIPIYIMIIDIQQTVFVNDLSTNSINRSLSSCDCGCQDQPYIFSHLFTWLHQVFAMPCKIFHCRGAGSAGPQHVGLQFPNEGLNLCPLILNHWTTREVPGLAILMSRLFLVKNYTEYTKRAPLRLRRYILGGFPGGTSGKESICQWRRHGFNSWVGKIPWRRAWQPTPVFLSGESQGKRSLMGSSPQGHKEQGRKESDTVK